MRVKVGAIVLAASVVVLSAVTFSMRSNLADVERTLDATEEAKAGVEAELETTQGELAATEDAKAGVEAESRAASAAAELRNAPADHRIVGEHPS